MSVFLPHHPDATQTRECGNTSESGLSGFCNLPVGHGGFHVAELVGDGTFAMWDDEKILFNARGIDWEWATRREVKEVVTTKVQKWVKAQ